MHLGFEVVPKGEAVALGWGVESGSARVGRIHVRLLGIAELVVEDCAGVRCDDVPALMTARSVDFKVQRVPTSLLTWNLASR